VTDRVLGSKSQISCGRQIESESFPLQEIIIKSDTDSLVCFSPNEQTGLSVSPFADQAIIMGILLHAFGLSS
jgi:hypothetical protein